MTPVARTLWHRFEPVHAVTYFAPQSREAFEAAGLRGFWRGYFAGRSAPLGAVGAGAVVATFFGFAPGTVRRALPGVWDLATPQQALDARLAGARAALAPLLADVPAAHLAEAADLAGAALDGLVVAGRPLAAANAELPLPDDAPGRLWHATTVLREHRGDGHVALLAAAGVDGVESLVWRAARHGDRELLQPARGWTDEEWQAGVHRLRQRGWLDADGLTPAGHAAHEELEARTDELAAGPWRTLGEERTARLAALLEPLTAAAAEVMPFPNPVGVPKPAAAVTD
ncbi:MAG: SCO6745 family protein [Motilibacteraceae bacterium]